MKRSKGVGLRLEPLDDRDTPATVLFHAGMLSVSHPTVTAGATSVLFNQIAANTFVVFDGGTNEGQFDGVTRIQDAGGPAKDTVVLDLGGQVFNGSVAIGTGAGDDTVEVRGSAGGINKGLAINTGAGTDTVLMNWNPGSGGLFVLGPTRVTDPAGDDTIDLGNGGTPSLFLGDVTLRGMNHVRLGRGQPDAYRNLTATVAGDSNPFDFLTSNTPAVITVFGNLRLTGGPGDDTVIDSSLHVTGNATLALGRTATPAGNFVSEYAGEPPLHVGGNFAYTGGPGGDSLILPGNLVDGDMALSLGDGNDVLDLSTLGGMFSNPRVGGDLTIHGGNGAIAFNGLTGEGITALVGGDLTVGVGSGSVALTLVYPPGGTFRWTSGNGSDALTLGPTAAILSWRVNIRLGNKDDTVTLGGAAPFQSITGSINFGGQATADHFNQGANWMVGAGLTLINLP